MNYMLLGLFIINMAFAEESVNIEQFCSGSDVIIENTHFNIVDSGFCNALSEIKKEKQEENEIQNTRVIENTTQILNDLTQTVPVIAPCAKNEEPPDLIIPINFVEKKYIPKDKWKLRLYASHSFTTYFSTDMKIRSSRYNIDIEDYEFIERGSRSYFLPETWKKPGNNPFQLLDEPTNTFTMSIERNGNEFFLSAFHPKFLTMENQRKHITGTIDGIAVDGIAPISHNTVVDGALSPGDMTLVRNQNTAMEMMFEIGYGKRINLLNGKAGSVVYTPSVALGFTIGRNISIIRGSSELEHYTDKFKIQGFGGTITNRLEYNLPKERFGLFYENRLSFYHQKHGLADGTQEYNLKLMGNTIGIKFMIYNPKNH